MSLKALAPFVVRTVSAMAVATLSAHFVFRRLEAKQKRRRRGWYLLVGTYTQPLCADPFAGIGGVPHDSSKVGRGIYVLWLDAATGSLELMSVCELGRGLPNPSYLTVHPSKRFVYACHETSEGIGEPVPPEPAVAPGGGGLAAAAPKDSAAESSRSSDLGGGGAASSGMASSMTSSVSSRGGGGVSALAVEEAADGSGVALRVLNAAPSRGNNPCFCVADRTGRCLLVANYGGAPLTDDDEDRGASVAMLPLSRSGDGTLNTAKVGFGWLE